MAERKPLTLWLTPQELSIFAIYSVMLCLVIPLHEPWVDESQAWLLARDLSIPALLFHNLRHEGHPALWYLILWIPSHLHMSFALFCWISGTIGALGIYVLLRFAPFPFYLRALLPFTFYLAYEYAVVARSYALFSLLGFAVADAYRQKPPRPIWMAIVLSLLANVSLHGTIVALVFGILYAWKLRGDKEEGDLQPPTAREKAWATIIFSSAILFVAVCVWPTRGALPRVSPTLNKVIDLLSIPESSAEPPKPSVTNATAPAPAAVVVSGVPTVSNPSSGQPGSPAIGGRLRTVPLVLGFAFAKSWIVAVSFESLVLLYLFRQRRLELILPAVFLALFLIFVYSAEWHLGLLWITFIMVLWASWDADVPVTAFHVQNLVAGFLALLCLFQLPWTLHAMQYEARNPVSPSKATAAYLHSLPEGLRIAGFGMSVGVQPYFNHNIFFNQRQAFGILGEDLSRIPVQEVIDSHPDVIVTDALQAPAFGQDGYVAVREYCGALYFPNRPIRPGCLAVLERARQAASEPRPPA